MNFSMRRDRVVVVRERDAMTRSVSSASSRLARGSFSSGTSFLSVFVSMRAIEHAREHGRLSSFRPCLNSDQPCL